MHELIYFSDHMLIDRKTMSVSELIGFSRQRLFRNRGYDYRESWASVIM